MGHEVISLVRVRLNVTTNDMRKALNKTKLNTKVICNWRRISGSPLIVIVAKLCWREASALKIFNCPVLLTVTKNNVFEIARQLSATGTVSSALCR